MVAHPHLFVLSTDSGYGGQPQRQTRIKSWNPRCNFQNVSDQSRRQSKYTRRPCRNVAPEWFVWSSGSTRCISMVPLPKHTLY